MRKKSNYDRQNAREQPLTFALTQKIKELVGERSYRSVESELGLTQNTLAKMIAMESVTKGGVKVNLDDLQNIAVHFGYNGLFELLAEIEA